MDVGGALLVAGAGLVGGAVNAAAGGGTLITFPALLAAGLPALEANITSSVGLLAGFVGGSVAYRRELAGQRDRYVRLGPAAVAGGVLGAVLLLTTSADAFRGIVPYLVLLACALLAVQPLVSRWLASRGTDRMHRVTAPLVIAVFVGGIYGSYFGAGLSVALLAVLGLLLHDDLQRLNALKGLLSLTVNIAGVVVFLLSARVSWGYAAVLAASAFIGAHAGVGVARRLPPEVLRYSIVTLGVAVATTMLVTG